MTEEQQTPITNQVEINVLLNDLKNVVKTRLLGINECIRVLRKNQSLNSKYKEDIALYKDARGKTNTILNRITVLLNKGFFSVEEFQQLRLSFIAMNIPNSHKDHVDADFES